MAGIRAFKVGLWWKASCALLATLALLALWSDIAREYKFNNTRKILEKEFYVGINREESIFKLRKPNIIYEEIQNKDNYIGINANDLFDSNKNFISMISGIILINRDWSGFETYLEYNFAFDSRNKLVSRQIRTLFLGL